MSVRIPRFFGVDPTVVDDGIVAKMSGTELRLFIYLMRRSDRYSTRKFKATDKDIVGGVGGSPAAYCTARKRLRSKGLIEFERNDGGHYVYQICDPATGKPYPGDPKQKPPYVKRVKRNSVQQVGLTAKTPVTIPTPIHDEAQTVISDPTDFDFGFNVEARIGGFNNDPLAMPLLTWTES